MKTKSISIFLCGIALALAFFGCGRSRQEAVEVGRPAPDFQLPDLNGNQIALAQFRGKVVILDFWATWCGPCRMSMPVLEKVQQEYADKIALLAINLQETPDEVRDYVQSQRITSKILLDQDGRTALAYRSESIPMQVLIDREGVVRYIQVGFSPGMGDLLKQEINKLL